MGERALVDRADTLATVLETDRTDVLVSALREYLREAAHDDEIKQEIAGAYYDGEIGFDQLKALVGHEEAANFRVLKDQLGDEFLEDAAELLETTSDARSWETNAYVTRVGETLQQQR